MESEGELDVDLESGGTSSEEDRNKDPGSTNGQTNRIFNWIYCRQSKFDGSVNGNLGSNSSKFGEAADENVELLVNKNSGEGSAENVAHLEKFVEGQRKKTNSRKPPKPPRPPKGPSLDAADQKLVREIAGLALRKRARIERIKALKRMKAAKSSASYTSLSAMIITILFCLVVVFQGLSSRSSTTMSMPGSPAPAVTRSESLVSVQLYKNFSVYEGDRPNSGSLYLEGQVPDSPTEKDKPSTNANNQEMQITDASIHGISLR